MIAVAVLKSGVAGLLSTRPSLAAKESLASKLLPTNHVMKGVNYSYNELVSQVQHAMASKALINVIHRERANCG